MYDVTRRYFSHLSLFNINKIKFTKLVNQQCNVLEGKILDLVASKSGVSTLPSKSEGSGLPYL